jgi:hypothetical protein
MRSQRTAPYNRVTIPCEWCGLHFEVWLSEANTRFHSLDCLRAWERSRWIERYCPVCGVKFAVPQWRLDAGRGKYCSLRCRGESQRNTPASIEARIDRSGGEDACHPWRGLLSLDGYGVVWWKGHPDRAHRVVWMLARGAIPVGLSVQHQCEGRYPPGDSHHRRCCNPAHLKVGTAKENTEAMLASGRVARSQQGARLSFTDEQVLAIRAAYRTGVTMHALAQRYGRHDQTISNLVHRRTAPHLP